MPMSQCTNATYQHVFHKKTFQSNANHPHADRYLGNIVNKFAHVQGSPGLGSHMGGGCGEGGPHVGRWQSWGWSWSWGQSVPTVNKFLTCSGGGSHVASD